jgi:hypothetical protein
LSRRVRYPTPMISSSTCAQARCASPAR